MLRVISYTALLGVMLLGAALLPAQAFAAGALPVTAKHIETATNQQEIKIAYPQTGIAAIDTDITTAIAQWRTQYVGEIDPGIPQTMPNSLEAGFDVLRNDSKMFVVAFNIYYFTGGAHPNTDFHTFNYLRADNERIYLPEIIGHDGIKALSNAAIVQVTRALKAMDGAGDTDWIKNGAGPNAQNFRAFAWLKGGVTIMFPAYQVAAYVYGPQTATIPRSVMAPFIRSDWRKPLASFDCAKATSAVEHAICGDTKLARLDREMADKYSSLIVGDGHAQPPQKTRAEQRAWLKTRSTACNSETGQALTGCLAGLYRTRLAVLKKTY